MMPRTQAVVDYMESTGESDPLVRVGWASRDGFKPFPGGGASWGCGGAGDDLYSYAFDGRNLWTGDLRARARMCVVYVV